MLDLHTKFLCDVQVDVEAPLVLGSTPHCVRMIYKITGGSVKGPDLTGDVLPMGADWCLVRPDGAGELDVRITIQTDDGELIYSYYRGIMDVSPEVFGRMATGQDVDPTEYYFRSAPIFETASSKYDWLNRIIVVGVGQLKPNEVIYKMYRVL